MMAKGDPHPQAGGKGQGREAIQDRFDGQQGIIAAEAVLNGAQDRHGAHAEYQAGGDESLGKAPQVLRRDAPRHTAAQPLAKALQAHVDAPPFAQDGADEDADGDDEDVLCVSKVNCTPSTRVSRPMPCNTVSRIRSGRRFPRIVPSPPPSRTVAMLIKVPVNGRPLVALRA